MSGEKPTIAKLEALLSDEMTDVEILPDGTLVALGATAEHDKSVILTFREEFGGDY